METISQIIQWLLDGDVSTQYQVHRDLLGSEQPQLRERISKEGWGARFISCRNDDGHWGRKFYQPKWTSTHYSLMDMKHLGMLPEQKVAQQTVLLIIRDHKGPDGGINPSPNIKESDVCLNGMFLNYACYFKAHEDSLKSIVDFLLSEQMGDGGFNCHSNRQGAVHSSLHSTISVLEGILEYMKGGYTYRLPELLSAGEESREFILRHRLFRSDRTGDIIDKKMLMLSYPSRWHYDILRALDYFRSAGVQYDPRMQDAIDVLMKKRRADGSWPLQARHPGQTHFDMEKTGEPSRWNTLRALRVLKHFDIERTIAAV
ncbi:prenyltransferase/squalene oxidase repeat-containing protein [Candidatus Omnitrophota bacterium]